MFRRRFGCLTELAGWSDAGAASVTIDGPGRFGFMPSSVIRAFDYHPDTAVLDVLFTTGRRYLYRAVPADVVEAMQAAASRGRFFNAFIRGRYAYDEVDG